METFITKRLPLKFDQNNNAIISFDFNELQSQFKVSWIDRGSEQVTITESAIYVTYKTKAAPKQGSSKEPNPRDPTLPVISDLDDVVFPGENP